MQKNTFITECYNEMKSIMNDQLTGDDWSVRFLHNSPSYYRTIKSLGRDASIKTYEHLLAEIIRYEGVINTGNSHPIFTEKTQRLKSLGTSVARHIASKKLTASKQNMAIRSLIIKAIEDVISSYDASYSVPPISIGF